MNDEKYDELAEIIAGRLNEQIKRSPQELTLKPDAQAKIKEFYGLCRSQMKQRMAIDDKSKTRDEHRLDRHKVAAAVSWAVARTQPIDTRTARTPNARLANEIVAFLASLQILLSFAAADAKAEGKPALESYFSQGPALPETTDKIAFTVHVARSFFWQVHRNSAAEPDIDKWLDPFQLAIMYYMIELFTFFEGQRKALGYHVPA